MKGKDKAYGNALFWGAALAIGGFFGSGLFLILCAFPVGQTVRNAALYLSGLSLIVFVIGLIFLLFTLLAGLRRTNGRPRSVLQYNDSKIIARYAVNGHGETLFDEYYMDVEDPKLKFYVRIQLPNGNSAEYHCNQIVWRHCGEAMTGTALIQGDWIGQFTPQFGAGQGNPYQDMA